MRLLSSLLLYCFASIALAQTSIFEQFYQNTLSFSASFEQSVRDAKGNLLEHSKGALKLKQPNKFILLYFDPAEQQYISDGKTLWSYDIDLEQVTIQRFKKELQYSPIFFLGDLAHIKKFYKIKESVNFNAPDRDVFLLTTKKTAQGNAVSSQFKSITLQFENKVLLQISLKDQFGQITDLIFSNQKSNQKMPERDFVFRAPENVDILDNRGVSP